MYKEMNGRGDEWTTGQPMGADCAPPSADFTFFCAAASVSDAPLRFFPFGAVSSASGAGAGAGAAFGDTFGDGAPVTVASAAGSAARAFDFFFFLTLLGAGSGCVSPAADGATPSFLAETFLTSGARWVTANRATESQDAAHSRGGGHCVGGEGGGPWSSQMVKKNIIDAAQRFAF